MIRNWTDRTYKLSDEWIYVSEQQKENGYIMLVAPGYHRGGEGFNILFTTEQITQVRALLKGLEQLQAQEILAEEQSNDK
ncbi:MAG: hypothetical protein AB4372_10755 [Xenococcus sp. (in: cyanobacteria)]